jgi:hypothetical protein
MWIHVAFACSVDGEQKRENSACESLDDVLGLQSSAAYGGVLVL